MHRVKRPKGPTPPNSLQLTELLRARSCLPWRVNNINTQRDDRTNRLLGYLFTLNRADNKDWITLSYGTTINAWTVRSHAKDMNITSLQRERYPSANAALAAVDKIVLDPLEYLACKTAKSKKNPMFTETRWMSTHDKYELAAALEELKNVECIRSWQCTGGALNLTREASFNFETDRAKEQIILQYQEISRQWSASMMRPRHGVTPLLGSAQEVMDVVEDTICDPLEILAHRASRQNPRKAKKNPFVISDIDLEAGIRGSRVWTELAKVKTHLTWTLVGRRSKLNTRNIFGVHGRKKFYLVADPRYGWHFAPMIPTASNLDVSHAPWISASSAQDVMDQIEELVAEPLELLAWKARPNPKKAKKNPITWNKDKSSYLEARFDPEDSGWDELIRVKTYLPWHIKEAFSSMTSMTIYALTSSRTEVIQILHSAKGWDVFSGPFASPRAGRPFDSAQEIMDWIEGRLLSPLEILGNQMTKTNPKIKPRRDKKAELVLAQVPKPFIGEIVARPSENVYVLKLYMRIRPDVKLNKRWVIPDNGVPFTYYKLTIGSANGSFWVKKKEDISDLEVIGLLSQVKAGR